MFSKAHENSPAAVLMDGETASPVWACVTYRSENLLMKQEPTESSPNSMPMDEVFAVPCRLG